MRIAILGLGVIGTTYAYAFKQAGHEVEHLIRPQKRANAPEQLEIQLLDGRYAKKGEQKQDQYTVSLSQESKTYDFILLSVRSGNLEQAVTSLREANIQGSLVFFCNFWQTREEIAAIAGDYSYIIGFPTAGGYLSGHHLEAVLFDHIMLEQESKSTIANYKDLVKLFESADIKLEVPHDMVEWIWIHMAVNAGVTSTAATLGDLSQPRRLAEQLMDSSVHLTTAVKVIRETLSIVEKRGVNLKAYRGEILPYKLPAWLAGKLMRKLFATNALTRRIMTLHNDKNDILYTCQAVYQTGLGLQVTMPLFSDNMAKIGMW